MYTPETDRELLVVYPDEQQARVAGRRLEELGVRPEAIDIGDETDEIVSLRAEMHEELTRRGSCRRPASPPPRKA